MDFCVSNIHIAVSVPQSAAVYSNAYCGDIRFISFLGSETHLVVS